MSERYPYPENEHYVFPKTRAEIINDELHYYQDPDEFREASIGIARLYAETPIINSMNKYAFLMNVVHVVTNGHGHESHVDRDFLMGTLYGVHTTVHTASVWKRRQILGYDPMSGVEGEEEDREIRQQIMGKLRAWEAEGVKEKLDEAPEDFQTALTDLTKHLYHGMGETKDQERSFITGYMFATSLIDSNHPGSNYGPI